MGPLTTVERGLCFVLEHCFGEASIAHSNVSAALRRADRFVTRQGSRQPESEEQDPLDSRGTASRLDANARRLNRGPDVKEGRSHETTHHQASLLNLVAPLALLGAAGEDASRRGRYFTCLESKKRACKPVRSRALKVSDF